MTSINPLRLSPMMASRKSLVLDFIKQYYGVHGKGPSLSEMAAAARTTKSRAHDLMRRLERDGLIHREPGVAHGVRPIEAWEEALRTLRKRGFVIDEDIFLVSRPGGTNAGLLGPPVLDHPPDDDFDGTGQDGESGQGEDGDEAEREDDGA